MLPFIIRFITFDGKNSAFLKSLNCTDIKNVPMNRMIDIRKTLGAAAGLGGT